MNVTVLIAVTVAVAVAAATLLILGRTKQSEQEKPTMQGGKEKPAANVGGSGSDADTTGMVAGTVTAGKVPLEFSYQIKVNRLDVEKKATPFYAKDSNGNIYRCTMVLVRAKVTSRIEAVVGRESSYNVMKMTLFGGGFLTTDGDIKSTVECCLQVMLASTRKNDFHSARNIVTDDVLGRFAYYNNEQDAQDGISAGIYDGTPIYDEVVYNNQDAEYVGPVIRRSLNVMLSVDPATKFKVTTNGENFDLEQLIKQ